MRPSSMRGAWLVGPMNIPENRYESDGMIEPIAEHAAQQIGPAQKRAVGRRRRAHREMIAAAGSGVASVEHEFLGAEAALPRIFVERGGQIATSSPQLCAGWILTSITPGSGVT